MATKCLPTRAIVEMAGITQRLFASMVLNEPRRSESVRALSAA